MKAVLRISFPFILGLAWLGSLWLSLSAPAAAPIMPDLVGLPLTNAQGRMSWGDVQNVQKPTYKSSTTQNINLDLQVFSTSPAAGEPITGTVVINYYQYHSSTMPDLGAWRIAAAIDTLTRAGVKTTSNPQQTKDITADGFVFSTSPAAGQPITGTVVINYYQWDRIMIDVVGSDCRGAVNFLQSNKVNAGSPELNPGYFPIGMLDHLVVTATNPAAGQTVKPGSNVILTCDTTPTPMTMPKVVGMTLSQAKTALNQANIHTMSSSPQTKLSAGTFNFGQGGFNSFTSNPQPTSNQSQDQIVTVQSPAAGKPVSLWGSVTLTYYQYQQPTMPNLIGKTLSDAKTALVKAGVTSTPSTTPTTTGSQSQDQKVYAQTPAVGQPITGAVTLTYYQFVTMPNVAGQTIVKASSLLNQWGIYNIGYTSIKTNNQSWDQKVISQDPTAGQPMTGKAVLTYYQYQQLIMPNVRTMTLSDAKAALAKAGITNITYSSQTTNNQKLDQTVYAQTPAQGQSISGSVTLNYYNYNAGATK